jgi:hypothetical protein
MKAVMIGVAWFAAGIIVTILTIVLLLLTIGPRVGPGSGTGMISNVGFIVSIILGIWGYRRTKDKMML